MSTVSRLTWRAKKHNDWIKRRKQSDAKIIQKIALKDEKENNNIPKDSSDKSSEIIDIEKTNTPDVQNYVDSEDQSICSIKVMDMGQHDDVANSDKQGHVSDTGNVTHSTDCPGKEESGADFTELRYKHEDITQLVAALNDYFSTAIG